MLHNKSRICQYGRTTCGKEVNIPRANSGLSIFQTSKKYENCSGSSASCNGCMQIDVIRLSLPKHHLLNITGAICKYYKESKNVYCGLKFEYCDINGRR